MKLRLAVLLLGVCAAMSAQDEEFTQWMKATAQANSALQKLEKKASPEAVAAAERLGGIYENMIGFWRQRNAEDAIKLSIDGKAAAVILASAANAKDEAKAAEAAKTLAGTCRPCHMAHREQLGEGKYRIK